MLFILNLGSPPDERFKARCIEASQPIATCVICLCVGQ